MAVIAPAHAQEVQEPAEAPRTVHLEALNVGDEYWFKVVGKKTENPELGFLPGEQIELHLSNTAHVAHNLRVGAPIDRALPLLEPGEEDVLRFTVPEDAAEPTQYWCEPHRELGMFGKVSFGEKKEGPRLEIPLPASMIWILLVVALTLGADQRRRSPP